MSTLNELGHSIRDTVDQLAEGWREFWHHAKNAITRFTPLAGDDEHPLNASSNRWGVMSAEVREAGDTVEVHLEAPGMNPDDFDIQVHDRHVYVRGQKQFRAERKEGRYHITERAYGRFERLIPLPIEVDDDSAVAHYKNGVLELTFQKHASATPRRITVN